MIGAFVQLNTDSIRGRSQPIGYIVQENGCWEWVGCTSRGYGQMGGLPAHQKKHVRAHRYYYECEYGPIPEGLELDHLCRNRKCVRPDHLEVVTSRENTLRGTSPAAARARQTHCKRGHPFTAENTRRDRLNRRYCIACERVRTVLRRGKREPWRFVKERRAVQEEGET